SSLSIPDVALDLPFANCLSLERIGSHNFRLPLGSPRSRSIPRQMNASKAASSSVPVTNFAQGGLPADGSSVGAASGPKIASKSMTYLSPLHSWTDGRKPEAPAGNKHLCPDAVAGRVWTKSTQSEKECRCPIVSTTANRTLNPLRQTDLTLASMR